MKAIKEADSIPKILIVMTVFISLIFSVIPSFASETGSIELTGWDSDGTEFRIYHIADYDSKTHKLQSVNEKYNQTVNSIPIDSSKHADEWTDASKKISDIISSNKIKPTHLKKYKNQSVKFEDLKLGLYFINGDSAKIGSMKYTPVSTLISIPTSTDKTDYSIIASVKKISEKMPESKTDNPSEDNPKSNEEEKPNEDFPKDNQKNDQKEENEKPTDQNKSFPDSDPEKNDPDNKSSKPSENNNVVDNTPENNPGSEGNKPENKKGKENKEDKNDKSSEKENNSSEQGSGETNADSASNSQSTGSGQMKTDGTGINSMLKPINDFLNLNDIVNTGDSTRIGIYVAVAAAAVAVFLIAKKKMKK